MVAIPFPLASYPGSRPQESAGRLINAFAEPLGPGARAAAVIKRTPGLREFADSALTGFRGQILVGNTLFAAFEDELVHVDSAGAVTSVGELLGTAPVFFARNNQSPNPQITVVTENGWYEVTTSSITEIVDADLPQPNSVCFLDGYFFLTVADSRCFASGLNDTTVNALDVAQAEAKSDSLVRGVAFERQLFLCGSQSIEIWTNTANATGFPFSRVAVISRGLVAPRAIAGFEDGFAKALVWVSDDYAVYTLQGYQAVRISTPDIDRAIESVSDKTTIEVSVYSSQGHSFVAVSSPGWTWELNLATERWHERKSYEQTRWRGTGNTALAFGKWLIGDTLSGKLLEITTDVFREVDQPLIFEVESAVTEAYPLPVFVPEAHFDFVGGVGIIGGEDPIEVDPRVGIAWSDDGGASWGNPILRQLGQHGRYDRKVSVHRTGRTGAKGRRWKLSVADPVYVGLTGGEMRVA